MAVAVAVAVVAFAATCGANQTPTTRTKTATVAGAATFSVEAPEGGVGRALPVSGRPCGNQCRIGGGTLVEVEVGRPEGGGAEA